MGPLLKQQRGRGRNEEEVEEEEGKRKRRGRGRGRNEVASIARGEKNPCQEKDLK